MSSAVPQKIVHQNLRLVKSEATSRFELWQGNNSKDQFIGFVGYTLDAGSTPPLYTLQHTIVAEEFSRQGYARAMVTLVMEYLKTHRALFISQCSYIDNFLQRYPEYQDFRAH